MLEEEHLRSEDGYQETTVSLQRSHAS